MGFYVNPKDCSKEEWLKQNAVLVSSDFVYDEVSKLEYYPICLVDNGSFTAAAILYNEEEADRFRRPSDLRPKKFWVALKEDLKEWYYNVD